MPEPQKFRVIMSTRRQKCREDKIPEADPKRDAYVVTCRDRQRITRFVYVQVPKGESPTDKHCPQCGGKVGLHDYERLRQRRPV